MAEVLYHCTLAIGQLTRFADLGSSAAKVTASTKDPFGTADGYAAALRAIPFERANCIAAAGISTGMY